MKKKTITMNFLGILVLSALLITSCQKASDTNHDTFTSTYQFSEEGRTISISGNSNGMPGEQAEYVLKISNSAELWQDEYYILLLDSDSVIKEISHERFNIPGGGGIQKPITFLLPEGSEGALGLCVMIPQRGILIATLSVGVINAISTGWPDTRTYPFATEL
jgi:hypothetical protein